MTIGGFFVVVAVIALRRRTPSLHGQLWRLLVPSWRLFDGSGHGFELHVRVEDESKQFGPWRSLTPRPGHPVFRAASSLAWGDRALLAQLAGELDRCDPERLAQTVAYRLVRDWATQSARGRRFQFRLRSEQDLLISAIHEC